MFKPKGLLKVISIIMIIFGVLGGLSVLFLYFMSPQLIEMGMGELIEGVMTPLSIVISIVSVISMIMAGVFGVSGKSMRWAMICGGIYTLIVVYNMISAILATGVSYTLLLTDKSPTSIMPV